MTLVTRPAHRDDAAAMCALLNPIIAEGSTTAHRRPFDPDWMCAAYVTAPLLIRTTLAFDGGQLMGFQVLEWADPAYDGPKVLPDGWAVIASFVKSDAQGKGIGQTLWRETLLAAKAAGVQAIDATIRADNQPGLAYYAGLGFQDYAKITGVVLSDGTQVDQIRKGFELAADPAR